MRDVLANLWAMFFVGTVVTAMIVTMVRGAPRPKPLPDESTPDVVTGFLSLGGGPTVEVKTQNGSTHVWLVFPNPQAEAIMLAGRRNADPIMATGRLGRGGNYTYLIVASLETP